MLVHTAIKTKNPSAISRESHRQHRHTHEDADESVKETRKKTVLKISATAQNTSMFRDSQNCNNKRKSWRNPTQRHVNDLRYLRPLRKEMKRDTPNDGRGKKNKYTAIPHEGTRLIMYVLDTNCPSSFGPEGTDSLEKQSTYKAHAKANSRCIHQHNSLSPSFHQWFPAAPQ